ncbi:MAG: hypothetical protein WD278_05005 [Pirellulales bacterium]
MSEWWDLKIIADREEEVRSVLAEVAGLLGIEPLEPQVALYPKFPRMWECRFEARLRETDPLDACARRFARLATPSWENRWDNATRPRKRECYEAFSDARRHLFAVDHIFWARVYCEVRAKRNPEQPT